MAILSKLVGPGRPRLLVAVWRLSSGQYRQQLLPAPPSHHLSVVGPIRLFRWDAKPDNQFGHSFPQGINAPAHPTFWIIMIIFLGYFINWRTVREYIGFSPLPGPLQESVEDMQGRRDQQETIYEVSSLAAEVYDKYGPEGVDALKAAWERLKSVDMPADKKVLHAVMMAQAAARYKKEVAEEAESLAAELENMVQHQQPGPSSEPVSGPKPLLERINVKAEESIEAEILEE